MFIIKNKKNFNKEMQVNYLRFNNDITRNKMAFYFFYLW